MKLSVFAACCGFAACVSSAFGASAGGIGETGFGSTSWEADGTGYSVPDQETYPTDRFSKFEVLSEVFLDRTEERPATRIRIVKTNLKYALVRVEDTFGIDQATNKERRIDQRAMVADHVLVKLKNNVESAEFQSLVASLGMKIRKRLRASGIYLVEVAKVSDENGEPEVSGVSIESVDNALVQLNQNAAIVDFAGPDYIVYSLGEPSASADLPNAPSDLNHGETGSPMLDSYIEAPEGWHTATDGVRILRELTASDIEYRRPTISANSTWTNSKETLDGRDNDGNGFVDDIGGWDFVGDDNDPTDSANPGMTVSDSWGTIGDVPLRFANSGGEGVASDLLEAIAYAISINVRPTLQILRGKRIAMDGIAGQQYRIEYTDSLGVQNSWKELKTIPMAESQTTIDDADGSQVPGRFYRAVWVQP